MNFSSAFAAQLLQIKAIKLNPQNPFTWASGLISPVYCDNRIVLSYPEARNLVVKALLNAAPEFGDFDVVAGVATAGIPHGALLAHELGKPFVYIRSNPKGHGRKNQIEGRLEAGKKVLVVEDLISTGGSSLKAVEVIREQGGTVVGVVALFTYGFARAETAFSNAACKLRTLTDYDTLINEAVQAAYVSAADMEMLLDWRKNPEKWAAPKES